MFGLGESVSIVGLGLQLWKKYKDAQKWETRDRLVDNQWFTLAIEKGVLEADLDYSWSHLERITPMVDDPFGELIAMLNCLFLCREGVRRKELHFPRLAAFLAADIDL